MTNPIFPWDRGVDDTEYKGTQVITKKEILSTSGSDISMETYVPEKKYGVGKPYRISLKGDITSDSRK